MSDTAAVIVFCCALTAICAPIFWVQSRLKKKRRVAMAAAAEAFRKRLASPDFTGLEKHFGRPLPSSFRAMYQDRKLIDGDDLLIGVPNPVERSRECYIAWFLLADLDNARDSWPGCEGLFPFADNGAGDQFLVDLRHADPEVIFHTHEDGKSRGLGVKLSAFLAAPRRKQPDQ